MDLTHTNFAEDTKREIYDKEFGLCIFCGRKCDPFFFDITQRNPNHLGIKSSKTPPFVSHPECLNKHSFVSRYRIHYILYSSGMVLASYCAYLVIMSGDIDSIFKLLIVAAALMSLGKILNRNQKRRERDFVDNLRSKHSLKNRIGKEFI